MDDDELIAAVAAFVGLSWTGPLAYLVSRRSRPAARGAAPAPAPRLG